MNKELFMSNNLNIIIIINQLNYYNYFLYLLKQILKIGNFIIIMENSNNTSTSNYFNKKLY
jgi:hypothetical protein